MKLMYLLTEPMGVGGVQSDMLALSEDLSKIGHDVYVATTPGVMLDELESRGGKFVNLSMHFKGLFSLLGAIFRLRKTIIDLGIDVLAPQSVRTTIISYFALRLIPFRYRVKSTGKRLPVITTIHNIHNPIHFKYAGWILNTCNDYTIFESHYERNRLLASGLQSEKSEVIHSGIDTIRFAPREPVQEILNEYSIDKTRHTVYGIVARLSEEKGHNYLLEAFSRVHKNKPDSRLFIIGDGPLMDETTALSEKLQLNDAVIFTGLRRNISDYLSILDVFVLSSTRESFPLAAREAMAAGRAVIAPDIGGCPEVVDEGVTGYLFQSRDSEELAQKMSMIVEDDKYLQFGKESRQRVERLFSRKSWIAGDERVYLDHFQRTN